MKNKIISSMLAAALIILSYTSVFAEDSQSSIVSGTEKLSNAVVLYVGSPNTIVKNKKTKVDLTNDEVKPFIMGNRTLVPLRFISESFGADVKYDSATKIITVVLNSTTIKLTVGENVMYVNGEAKTIDVAAQIINDRTFIPLRAMVDAIGKKLFWDASGMIVISDTENLLDSTKDKVLIDNVIGQLKAIAPQGQQGQGQGKQGQQGNNMPNGMGNNDMPGLMGKVVSVSGNTITVEAGAPMGGMGSQGQKPTGQSAQTQATTTTITVSDGMTVKKESMPNDTNPTDISISDIKAGMLVLVWYTDNTKQTISKIRVTQPMAGGAMGANGVVPNGNGGASMGGKGGGQGQMASADLSAITNKWLDVPYATVSNSQKLDVLLPNTGNGPFPVIVAIHGGAFMMGDKSMCESGATLKALENGYAIVSVNYRLSGEAIFPAAINDVKAAIRFIRANASKYNLNTDKIAVWGSSAGGNLAALVGTSSGVKELTDLSLGNAEQSDSVQAVVDWFGPLDFLKMDEQFVASGVSRSTGNTSAADSPESKYIGQLITKDISLTQKANPETYINTLKVDSAPYFFIEHGTSDGNVPTQQSINFAASLKSVIGESKVTLTLLEGAGHGGTQFETTENVNKVFTFLDKYLK